MIGERLGHYEITAELGHGGLGAVYRAVDTRLDREVAIKILPEVYAQDVDRLARFSRDAKVLASLDNANIGAIYGVEVFDGRHCLVLELIEGETLAEKLAPGPLSQGNALAIAKQMADALAAAHERGVIHRDLKPANIKLVDEQTVKVLDFGLAKLGTDDPESKLGRVMASTDSNVATVSTESTQPNPAMGTLAYMSPEQSRGLMIDQRTDIWALGCCLFEMLTGQKPFHGDADSDLLEAILKEEPDWSLLPASTPPAVLTLIRRCLDKEGHRRLSSAADIAITLEETSHISRHGTALMPDEQGAATRRPEANATWGGLKLVLGAIVLAGFIYAVMDVISNRQSPQLVSPGEIRSIGILPFEVLGEDPGLATVARGVEDQIREELQRINALNQSDGSRSVAQYEGSALDKGEIASELGVDGLVFGTIRQIEGQIEASLNLVYGPEASAVLSTNLSNAQPLVLADQISLTLLEQFQIPLESEEATSLGQSDPVDFETFRLFQEGLELLDVHTVASSTKAIESLTKAIEQSPQFIPAYLALAKAHWMPSIWGGHTSSGKEGIEAAKEVIAAAETQAPEDLLVSLTKGFLAMIGDFDWVAAKRAIDQAIGAGIEEPEVYDYYGWYLALVEARYQDALRAFDRAASLSSDPFAYAGALAEVNSFLDRNETALEFFRSFPSDVSVAWDRRANRALTLKRFGMTQPGGEWLDQALAEARSGVSDSRRNPMLLAVLAEIHAARGESAQVENLLAEIEEQRAGGQFVPSIFLARVAAQQGELGQAVDYLRDGLEGKEGFSLLYGSRKHDLMDALAESKSYWDLLDEFGFPPLPFDHPFYEQERQMRFQSQAEGGLSRGPLGVLSFVPEGAEALEMDWLSMALRDELVKRLVDLEGADLHLVRSDRPNEGTNWERVCRSLGGESLVHGTYSYRDQLLKIGVQRYDVASNTSSLVGEYSGELGDLPRMLGEIGEGVLVSQGDEFSDAQREQLSEELDVPMAAFEAYYQGMAIAEPLFDPGRAMAVDRFSEARRLEPRFVAPYLRLAELTWRPTQWGNTRLSAEQAFVQVKALLASAERFGMADLELQVARGMSSMVGDWDWNSAYQSLASARASGRDSVAMAWYLLLVEGRYSEALEVMEAVLADEPLDVRKRVAKASLARFYGKWQEAKASYERIGIARLDWQSLLGYVEVLRELGQADAALALVESAVERSNGHPSVVIQLVETLAAQSRVDEAKAKMREIEARLNGDMYFPPAGLAMAYHSLGEMDLALSSLETGFDDKGSWAMLSLRSARHLKAFGEESRYWDLVSAMDFPELPVYHPARDLEQSGRRGD